MNEGAYRGHNLVFIVGSPRSGTTWLQRLLVSHENIHTGQEPCLFGRYVGPQLRAWRWELTRENSAETSTGRGGIGLSCYFQEQEFVAILRDYMCRLLAPMTGGLRPGELFIDKTPMNALYLSEIRELLPESRFIHLIRDPRDVVASFLAASQGWGSGWAPGKTKKAIKTWVRHVHTVIETAKNIPRSQFLEVRYERLLAAPEETLREVGEFLSLEWQPGAIRTAIEKNRAEAVRAGGGTPIPLYGEVAKRVGGVVRDPADFIRYAEDSGRANLRLRDKCVIWYAAKQIMRQTGYLWSWRDWKGF